MFENLRPIAPDALHDVMHRFQNDPREDKVDLGVGVYKDATGQAPIMEAVMWATAAALKEETTKAYGPLKGNERFIEGMTRLLFKETQIDPRISSIQTVGGTGGIRLALELARANSPDLRVFVGSPSWPNHKTICQRMGISLFEFTHTLRGSTAPDLDALHEAISMARKGDVFIIHGPCHNPTGVDYSQEQFLEIIKAVEERGAMVLIDAAYYGLGNPLEEDLEMLRLAVETSNAISLVMSCSKAFGLYRERIGILFVKAQNTTESEIVQATLEKIGRSLYSMPPSHGGWLVGRILADEELEQVWRNELHDMRDRLNTIRACLSHIPGLNFVNDQKGIFALLPIRPEDVAQLERENGIYMPSSGRINIAGINDRNINLFTDAYVDLTLSMAK